MKYNSVEELIKFLQTLPPETKIYSHGPDCGGYDVSEQNYLTVTPYKDGILFSHDEFEQSELRQKNEQHNK